MKIQLVLLGLAITTNYVVCGTIRQLGTSCPMFCPEYYHPVCGSDGKTYVNDCYLKVAQCKDASLSLAHDGPCAARYRRMICTTPMCWPTYEPVCGSDGVTYGNGCHFSNAHCYDLDLKMEHQGPCKM